MSQIFLAVNKSSNVCGKFFCKESMLWLQKFNHCKPAYFHCIAIKSILDFNLMLTVVSGFVPFGSPMVSVFLIYEFSICNRNIKGFSVQSSFVENSSLIVKCIFKKMKSFRIKCYMQIVFIEYAKNYFFECI